MYKVIDRFSGKQLNAGAILNEVNRERSETWTPYTRADLERTPADVLSWLDSIHYEIKRV